MSEQLLRTPDPFALYHAPLRQLRAWRVGCLLLGASVALLLLSNTVLALRPPLVIVKDRSSEAPPSVGRFLPEPARSSADARLFFSHVLRLRYGWDSLTVQRDLQDFLQACYKTQRTGELAYLQAAVAGTGRQAKTMSRLQHWMAQSVRNQLILPDDFSAIDCRRKSQRRQWDCYVKAEILSAPMLSAQQAARNVAVRQPMHFMATLLEVPHSAETPYGLVLAALLAEPQAPAAPARAGGVAAQEP